MQCSEELWLKGQRAELTRAFGQESGRYATGLQKPLGLGTCGLCVCVCVSCDIAKHCVAVFLCDGLLPIRKVTL